jgi:undecaprenyl-diphosphatase
VSELDYLTAIVLGVIQGVTEFLPISSSGHLALTQRWLDLDPGSTEMLLFDVLVHCGTLIAVFAVFRREARRYVIRLARELRGSFHGRRYAWRIALLAVIATIPTAGFGFALKDHFEAAFDKPAGIGICLIVTGCMLAALAKLSRGRRGWKRLRWWEAALVGIAQASAILPGISRSGATICIASYCGWRRQWAAEFSFLIAVPAIVGGTILKFSDALHLPAAPDQAVAYGPVMVGGMVSLLVGVVALSLLLHIVRRAKLHHFAPYCWLVGVLALVAGL